jgi:ATP-binding cassette, subfamily B, bacterial
MRPLGKILSFASHLWKYYLWISIFTVVLSVSQLMQPLITGRLVDILKTGTIAKLSTVVILVVLIFLQDIVSGFLNNINGYLGDRMGAQLQMHLAEKYFSHLLSLPQSYFDRELSGKIIGRLQRSSQQITQFITMFSNAFLQFVLTTILSLGLAFRYSWLVGLQLSLLYPIFIFMTIKASNKWQKWQGERNTALDIAAGRFAEVIGQIKVVKSFRRETGEEGFFHKYMNKFVDIGTPQSKYFHKRDVEKRVILAVIFLGVFMTIFLQARNGVLTAGQAVTLVLLSIQIRIPIFTINFLVEGTQRAIADSKDYFEVMEQTPAQPDMPGSKKLVVGKGKLDFENVAFGYDDTNVLKGITFSLPAGKRTALVGESGEGKTTITSLLMRLYETNAGTIIIDGQDISKITAKSLREQIGVVFQDPALFSGTIRSNIAYANPKATDKQVLAAAKAANAHEFIEKLEKGYDTEIGERGLKLSGGQKQRIAIARAVLKDAPILILDEATSSLDNKSELLVQEALESLMKGRTTIIIAHRLSTIQNVDQIVTLKNGVVDEVGSPAVLAKSKGIYAKLLALSHLKSAEQVKKALQEFDIKA